VSDLVVTNRFGDLFSHPEVIVEGQKLRSCLDGRVRSLLFYSYSEDVMTDS
jgi:hypothetical protein